MQIFRSGKDGLPKHKPVIYICNVTPLIVHLLSFVKVTADFIPKINRPLGEEFVVDINGIEKHYYVISNTQRSGEIKYKKHFHWKHHSYNSWT